MTRVRLDGLMVRMYLKREFTDDAELVDEYCNEFEHQDGLECWANYFKLLSEVGTDFQLYKENRND